MKKVALCSLLIALSACGGTKVVDLEDKTEVSMMENVMELEYRDWEKTANSMTKGMLASGAFAKVKNPVIAIGRITNDTMQRFDTDVLIKKIRSTIVNSGTAQITTAIANNIVEDNTTHVVRDLRSNSEYEQGTIAAKGTLIAPNLSLSGKMIQRNLNIKGGWFDNTDTRVEYYLQLTLTNVKTGLSVWEQEQPIVKEGDHAPTW